jgi:LmbE family N-acetylglucosaminyl deacetylase
VSAVGTRVRVAGVFAHPDDDVYQLGGWLAAHADDVEAVFVFCTSGEAGPITDPSLATRETLGSVREGEQRASMERVGVPCRSTFLRHPDYRLPDVPLDALIDAIAGVLAAEMPEFVVSFGPDGLTSHHDHIRAGEAAEAAFHRVRADVSGRVLRALYQVALPRSDVDRFYREIGTLDPGYGVEGTLFNLVGVDDDRIAVRVDTGGVRDRKLAAILEHRTQVCELERIPETLRWIHLDREHFARAWPVRAPGGTVASDLFDDLATLDEPT